MDKMIKAKVSKRQDESIRQCLLVLSDDIDQGVIATPAKFRLWFEFRHTGYIAVFERVGGIEGFDAPIFLYNDSPVIVKEVIGK